VLKQLGKPQVIRWRVLWLLGGWGGSLTLLILGRRVASIPNLARTLLIVFTISCYNIEIGRCRTALGHELPDCLQKYGLDSPSRLACGFALQCV